MKNEQEITMKQIKPLLNKALMIITSVFVAVVLIALIAQAISLTFYTLLLAAGVSTLGYLFFRTPNDSSNSSDS